MFLPLSIQASEVRALTNYGQYRRASYTSTKTPAQMLKESINLETGEIDAKKLQNGWLPVGTRYDVFISYSHNDKIVAENLAAWLEHKGLKVFIDSEYWNSADELLKEIDNRYSKSSDGELYNYYKRNYSTSVIHAILSMAILEAIDKSDVAFFVGSQNSLALNANKNESATKSPWIFEEISFLSAIEKRKPDWLHTVETRFFSSRGAVEVLDESLFVRFTIPTNKLIEVYATRLNYLNGIEKTWLQNLYKMVERKYKSIYNS